MALVKCITLEEEKKKQSQLKLSDIQILKEWCEKQPHLPKIEDVQFAIFLHSNYYSIESTKSCIENYYTIRTNVSEIFANRNMLELKELRESFKITCSLQLKDKTKEGYDIFFAGLLVNDPLQLIFNDVMKNGFMIYDECLWTTGSSAGCVLVNDCKGTSLGHIGRINFTIFKKLLNYVQNGIPARLMGIHFINISPFIEVLFNMMKPFIKEEFSKIIYFHSTMNSANEYFPLDALPNEFGGKGGAAENLINAQVKKLEDFRDWFSEDERINRVNNSLRIEKKTSSDLFNVEGSFRKLELD